MAHAYNQEGILDKMGRFLIANQKVTNQPPCHSQLFISVDFINFIDIINSPRMTILIMFGFSWKSIAYKLMSEKGSYPGIR